MHVGVLGCGSLGTVIAARLWKRSSGIGRITAINRNPQIRAAWEEGGLRIVGPGHELCARPAMVSSPGEAEAPFDLVVLATKSGGLEAAARELLPFLADGGFLLTTQNGLIGWDLAEDAVPGAGGRPALPLVPGAVLWGASMDSPGRCRITARGPFIIGEASGERRTPRLARAAAVLRAAFPVAVSPNIRGVLWSKLAITATFTALGAVTGLRFGELVRRREVCELLLRVGAEVGLVARAEGIRLESLGAGLDAGRLLSPSGYPHWLKLFLMRAVGRRHGRTESSMLASLRRGRPTEVGFINARVVDRAAAHGIEAPLNRTVARLIGEMEEGRRSPGLENLAEL
jgi:2-dehydropantoate 2-reductase